MSTTLFVPLFEEGDYRTFEERYLQGYAMPFTVLAYYVYARKMRQSGY
jgi:hypothetical protein